MKKLCVIVCVAILGIFGLVGCSNEKTQYDAFEKQVSYRQDSYYIGSNAKLMVELSTGRREKHLVADGKVGEMSDFTMLQVTPMDQSLYSKEYTFNLIGEKGSVEGVFEKNVIGLNYTAIIGKLSKIGEVKSVEIIAEDVLEKLDLTNPLQGEMDASKALECVFNEMKDSWTAEEMNKGKFLMEVGVKVVNDMSVNDGSCYWYVTLAKDTSKMMAFLIEPSDGSIISKKI